MCRLFFFFIFFINVSIIIKAQKLILWDMNSIKNINYKIEYKNVKQKIINKADTYLKQK